MSFVNEFLNKNLWAILVLSVSLIISYTIYGTRISALEERVYAQEEIIAGFRAIEQANQITLAKMQKDIEFIKIKVDNL